MIKDQQHWRLENESEGVQAKSLSLSCLPTPMFLILAQDKPWKLPNFNPKGKNPFPQRRTHSFRRKR